MEFNSIIDIVGKDRTNVYTGDRLLLLPAFGADLSKAEPGQYYFLHPHLRYGDYDDSTSVERSNVRVFEERFKEVPGWQVKTMAYSARMICVDVTCTDQAIIDTLVGLFDYPLLSEEDLALVEEEMLQESFFACEKQCFIDRLNRKFDKDYSDMEEDKLYELFLSMLKTAGVEPQYLSGGNVYVNLSVLVDNWPTAPAL